MQMFARAEADFEPDLINVVEVGTRIGALSQFRRQLRQQRLKQMLLADGKGWAFPPSIEFAAMTFGVLFAAHIRTRI
jgi:hypothetical protein